MSYDSNWNPEQGKMTPNCTNLSKCIERGSVRPVATNAARKPEATDGLIEFVGVRAVEQLDDDWPNTGRMR